MTRMLLCDSCGRETDAPLCGPETAELGRELRKVPDLLADLDLTLARADRLGDAGRGGEQPVPWKEQVPEAVWVLGNVLTTWLRETAERRSLAVVLPERPRRPRRAIPPGARADADGRPAMSTDAPDPALESIRAAAQWLAEHLDELRQIGGRDGAVQAHDEITDALTHARRAIDRPGVRVFVGRCDACDGDLYGFPHRASADCEGCGAVYEDMAQRWDLALIKLRQRPETAAVIAHVAGELFGVMIDRKLINQWHSRGLIAPADWLGPDGSVHREPGDGRDPRFLFGDVIDRAQREPRRGRRERVEAGSTS